MPYAGAPAPLISNVRCNKVMRLLISSLESIGDNKAIIGGIVTDGVLQVGSTLQAKSVSASGIAHELRAYGKNIEAISQGMSVGIVVSLLWAQHLHLGEEITSGT